ncbi:MAG: pentapeptide repeat-containing protein [Rhizonema sp. NSF051]|nr:pentapeptide repeat-containing protein [Rhizonema sp. NSF051]
MPQDYSGQNIRGRSFKGQNLELADFSGADIRSADFSGANLIGANFSGAKAGLQRRWAIFLVLVSWLLMGISGFFLALTGFLMESLIFQPQKGSEIAYQTTGFAVAIILIIFCFVTIRQGIQAGLGVIAITIAIAFALAIAISIAITSAIATTSIIATTAAVAFAFAIAGAFAFAIVFAIAFAIAGAFAFASAIAITIIFAVAFAGTKAGVIAGVFAGSTAGAIALFSIYISLHALEGDPKHVLIREITVAFAAFQGTSFRKANLSNANFTAATLKSTDFRRAILTRTSFHKTLKLYRGRPGATYLQKTQVCQVLVTGFGQDQNFDRLDLRGVNFQGAILIDASFVGADLSKANLQDADLSRAKLVQAQLDGTDFTGATLTGAYIRDWNITSDTKFDGVRCEYVYMRLPTKENPDPLRKPDNNKEVFKDGEFGDFIKPIFDTLDLYHNQGVDPRAIAISFKQLAENNPAAELRIVGMEVRGEDKFLIRAKTESQADKSLLSQEYFENYNQIKALTEQELQRLIAEKDNRIRSLENMVNTALQRPSFYAQTVKHNNSTIKTILILASNPKTTPSLRLNEEVREIEAGLRRAKKRELFNIRQRQAVRVPDVYEALLDLKPQFVHFIGHGSGENGLVLEDETGNERLVTTVALANLFKLFANDIECVVLNACYSEVQAQALAEHIPYVVGMNKAIADQAAIKFATGFYSAIASGESVEFAYKLGCNVIQLEGIAEHLTPVLKKR